MLRQHPAVLYTGPQGDQRKLSTSLRNAVDDELFMTADHTTRSDLTQLPQDHDKTASTTTFLPPLTFTPNSPLHTHSSTSPPLYWPCTSIATPIVNTATRNDNAANLPNFPSTELATLTTKITTLYDTTSALIPPYLFERLDHLGLIEDDLDYDFIRYTSMGIGVTLRTTPMDVDIGTAIKKIERVQQFLLVFRRVVDLASEMVVREREEGRSYH